MNVWSSEMAVLTDCSGMNKLLNPYTAAYPANHHKACGGRRKQTFGYKRQALKKRRPTTPDRDEAPRKASRSILSKGIVSTNNKKVQRTIFGLVLARPTIYIIFLGRIEDRVVSRRSPVSVCRIIKPQALARECHAELSAVAATLSWL
jgi:hypothetical protein